MKNAVKYYVVNTFDHDGYTVNVVYIEWAGGACNHEFEVWDGPSCIHRSNDGYGQPLPAAAGAYEWLLEN